MDRIKTVEFKNAGGDSADALRLVKCVALDGTEQMRSLKPAQINLAVVDGIEDGGEVSYVDMFIEKLTLNAKLKRTAPITFKGCVFPNKTDLNFHEADCRISFKDCVFLDDFCLFGTFYESVSFENVSFINSSLNFQECYFSHFVFRITTLINSRVCFQQTEFWSKEVDFDNMHLYNSVVDFANSDFAESSELLNMLCVNADEKSHIRFIMVDFDFDEFRLSHSDIECLRFLECTFNCRRFEFDCVVKSLTMQKCVNDGTISFGAIKELRDFNIVGFANKGCVLVGNNPQIFIDAAKTNAEIVWAGGHNFRAATHTEKNAEIYDIGNFYIPNQTVTERLCFGTFAKKFIDLDAMQQPYNGRKAFVELLFLPIIEDSGITNRNGNPFTISDKITSDLLNFKIDVRTEIQNRASMPDMREKVFNSFKDGVVPCIKESLREDLRLKLVELVKNDKEAQLNKALLINAESDKLANFLTDVFLYAIQKPNKT